MNVATAQHAARHECGHAVALAARTGILTESIFVGCKPGGACAAGINGSSKIPLQAGTSADWIIYNLAGYAAEKAFDPAGANREGALRDDIVVEKILRATWEPETWILMLGVVEVETAKLVQSHRACIDEMATTLLDETPREVTVLGAKRHVYRLGADKIEEILAKHGLQTPHRFECGYTDEQFERLLERHALNVRIAETSPTLAAEFYNHRRFVEAKQLARLDSLDHQAWLDNFGGAKVEILTPTSGTALVLIFTQQGFVLAADGLEREASGKTLTTSSQKIFQLREHVAFSCAGFRSIRNGESGETTFELPTTVRDAFEEAMKSFSGDFEGLAEDIAEKVCAKLAELKEEKKVEDFPEEEDSDWFAQVFLAGYFHGEPRAAVLSFRRAELKHCEATVENLEIEPGRFAYTGSRYVWQALKHDSDAKLRVYRCKAFDRMMSFYGPNMDEAELIAQAYIHACGDPAVREVHPECKSIGGSIRVARITTEVGFKWISQSYSPLVCYWFLTKCFRSLARCLG